MDECDHPLGPPPRRTVDELDPVARQRLEGSREIVDHVADVMERRFRVLGNELGDARLAIGRLDQLDPPLCVAEEDHANALIRQVADRLGVKSERVAEERERVIEA